MGGVGRENGRKHPHHTPHHTTPHHTTPHHTTPQTTPKTHRRLLALIRYLPEQPLKVLRVARDAHARVPHSLYKSGAIRRREEDARAGLADAVQDVQCVLEEPDVEHRELKVDMPKVAAE